MRLGVDGCDDDDDDKNTRGEETNETCLCWVGFFLTRVCLHTRDRGVSANLACETRKRTLSSPISAGENSLIIAEGTVYMSPKDLFFPLVRAAIVGSVCDVLHTLRKIQKIQNLDSLLR